MVISAVFSSDIEKALSNNVCEHVEHDVIPLITILPTPVLLQLEHSLKPESLRSLQTFSLHILILIALGALMINSSRGFSSSSTDVIRTVGAVLTFSKPFVIDGRGLFVTEDDAAEFRRELADNVAILPRARMAFPVFYAKQHQTKQKK